MSKVNKTKTLFDQRLAGPQKPTFKMLDDTGWKVDGEKLDRAAKKTGMRGNGHERNALWRVREFERKLIGEGEWEDW